MSNADAALLDSPVLQARFHFLDVQADRQPGRQPARQTNIQTDRQAEQLPFNPEGSKSLMTVLALAARLKQCEEILSKKISGLTAAVPAMPTSLHPCIL